MTADGALGRIEEDLAELDTDYLDVFYLRTYNQEMLAAHFGPGGAVEGVLKAKAQGKVRNLGLAGHSDLLALTSGIETGLVDACMFPLNVVRREALEQIVPAALKHDVGMVIMKPMSVGMAPAEIALPWLANQPIHVMAPGVSNLEQLELDARVLDRSPMAFSPAEEAEAERWRFSLDTQACRICDKMCQPVCEPQIPIDVLIYHDVFQNEARALGKQGFLDAPMAPWVRSRAEDHFARVARIVDTCTHCGKCEEVCPYHLPIMGLLDKVKTDSEDMAEALREAGWKQSAADAPSPWAKPGKGGKQFMS
jgi:predicted aldo/keto reductase-like oxidoreductase